MKFRILSIFAIAACLSFVSCKNDPASTTDAARESLATTNTTTTTTQTAKPATPAPANDIPAGPLTSMEFKDSTFDYGDIKDGDKVEHTFAFTNTGSEPLIISNAKGSCGCTVPDWPKEPIAVGQTGEIKVVFNSKGKGGVDGKPDTKKVTITANTDPAQTFLTIKGKIFKEEGAS